MLQRVDAEEYGSASAALDEPQAHRVVPAVAELDREPPPLPRDRPRTVKDALAVSQRAREIVARLRPIVLRVLTFWDHRMHSALVGGRNVSVDPSGCYRVG